MLKPQAEFTDMLFFDRNYWTSGNVSGSTLALK